MSADGGGGNDNSRGNNRVLLSNFVPHARPLPYGASLVICPPLLLGVSVKRASSQ